jgi:flavin-dependent dehydrogenase
MRSNELISRLLPKSQAKSSSVRLENGSRVAIMGGGPAGSFFAYFLLDMAQKRELSLQVDLYEPRDFSRPGPAGCNMDAGIISELLVQRLAAEGINLPPTVIERGLDAYVLHMDVGSARIESAVREKRIASVYRGVGPIGSGRKGPGGFDAFCLAKAVEKGARWIARRVDDVRRGEAGVLVGARDCPTQEYALLAVATGVNTNALRLFPPLEIAFRPPVTVRSVVREYALGKKAVERYLGNAFHVFLLDLPGMDFAGIVPKGDHATICFLGTELSDEVFDAFLDSPEVRACMPPGWEPDQFVCHCAPRMNVGAAIQPFAERMVFIGDSGVSRLYKDGIGAAYRTAKAAARTALFHGIAYDDFRDHFWPLCQTIVRDNQVGRLIFFFSRQVQHHRFARYGMLQTVIGEQQRPDCRRHASWVLWDMFTGSAPYREIFLRALHPAFFGRLLWHIVAGVFHGDDGNGPHSWRLPVLPTSSLQPASRVMMATNDLGRFYADGEVIVREGEKGDRMYVILEGEAEVVLLRKGQTHRLALLGQGEFFGEMDLLDPNVRSASVRAVGSTRVLTVDKKTLLHSIQEDPELALHFMRTLVRRLRQDAAREGRLPAAKGAQPRSDSERR